MEVAFEKWFEGVGFIKEKEAVAVWFFLGFLFEICEVRVGSGLIQGWKRVNEFDFKLRTSFGLCLWSLKTG